MCECDAPAVSEALNKMYNSGDCCCFACEKKAKQIGLEKVTITLPILIRTYILNDVRKIAC